MTTDSPPTAPHPLLRILRRKNVLAGLMFIAVAALGLWLSRNYPVGTALRMSTGYVPRLLCWILMGLGLIVLVQGLREQDLRKADAPPRDAAAAPAAPWRAIVAVSASLIAFALSLERLGLILSIGILVALASTATRELKAREAAAAAVGLAVLCWAIFVFGLGLPIPVGPDW